MTLDSENQRKLLQDLMDSVSFSGRAWKEVYELRVSVDTADVVSPVERLAASITLGAGPVRVPQ